MKLYVYKHARVHTHDTIPIYVNTTPFSKDGIQTHCTVVDNPDDADFFYMGQISDGNMDDTGKEITEESFTYLPGRVDKHILDLEGDWCEAKSHTACGRGRSVAPPWVLQCIKSCAPTKYAHWVQPVMARPNLSRLQLFFQTNPECDIEYPDYVSFGFRGQLDPINTRTRMAEAIKRSGAKNEITFNTSWGGHNDLDSPAVSEYINSLYCNLLSLCPEGVSSATIRFYETCFFGRVPIIVGEQMIMEEGDRDTSFVYKIDPTGSDEKLQEDLMKIYNTPLSELIEKGKMARQYYLDVVMKYYADPTAYMINWMKRKELLK